MTNTLFINLRAVMLALIVTSLLLIGASFTAPQKAEAAATMESGSVLSENTSRQEELIARIFELLALLEKLKALLDSGGDVSRVAPTVLVEKFELSDDDEPVLYGEVDPNGNDNVEAWFEWADSKSYLGGENSTTHYDFSDREEITGKEEVSHVATLKVDFDEEETYFYRIGVESVHGITYSSIKTFSIEDDEDEAEADVEIVWGEVDDKGTLTNDFDEEQSSATIYAGARGNDPDRDVTYWILKVVCRENMVARNYTDGEPECGKELKFYRSAYPSGAADIHKMYAAVIELTNPDEDGEIVIELTAYNGSREEMGFDSQSIVLEGGN